MTNPETINDGISDSESGSLEKFLALTLKNTMLNLLHPITQFVEDNWEIFYVNERYDEGGFANEPVVREEYREFMENFSKLHWSILTHDIKES